MAGRHDGAFEATLNLNRIRIHRYIHAANRRPQKDQNGDQSPEAAQKHNQPKTKRHGGGKGQKTDTRAKMTDDAPCQGHRSHSAKAKR